VKPIAFYFHFVFAAKTPIVEQILHLEFSQNPFFCWKKESIIAKKKKILKSKVLLITTSI